MARRIVAIVNPISGREGVSALVRRVSDLVALRGVRMDTLVTEHAGHATRLAAELATDVEAVLIVGGDGTVCEVVNGLDHRPVPLAILATGTENLVARQLSMPTDPIRLAEILSAGRSSPCDLGRVNDRVFVAMVGVGFDAECVARMTEQRHGHITHLDYARPILDTVRLHAFPPISVVADGECVFDGSGVVVVGNFAQYGGGLRLLADARHDDGFLDVCVLPCTSTWGLAAHVYRAFRGVHVHHEGVVYRQARTIDVSSSQDIAVQVDGDAGLSLPIHCSIQPNTIRYLREA